MINDLFIFFKEHPYASTFITTFVWSAFVGALPAPRANASQFYIFVFRFFNLLAGNIARGGKNPRVEDSPNFTDAVIAKNGGTLEKH